MCWRLEQERRQQDLRRERDDRERKCREYLRRYYGDPDTMSVIGYGTHYEYHVANYAGGNQYFVYGSLLYGDTITLQEESRRDYKTMKTTAVLEALQGVKTRSQWDRGVIQYAIEIVRARDESEIPNERVKLHKYLLNGAMDWREYSYGGCSLIYDMDIAERLCTKTELKKVDGGRKEPNERENWLDVQTRALTQAEQRVYEAAGV